jgi:hypothetical protein
MNVRFSCLPGWEPYLPKPRLASGYLPDWLKSMPSHARSGTLSSAEVRTVKQCPPFIDAMKSGILFPLATDLTVKDGEFTWKWDLPPHPDSRMTRSPIGVHVPEQAAGVPGIGSRTFLVKFTNFWTVSLPEGWSMLFTHPLNRLDLPFRTLSGMVSADQWTAGFVHFPAVWTDESFEGVLEAGTPIAQAFPVPRGSLNLDVDVMDQEALDDHLAVQDKLQDVEGVYRKDYRR